MKKLATLLTCVSLALSINAQKTLFTDVKGEEVHRESTSYEWPTDPEVLKKLDHWQDQKFGIMFHWGIYSVPGITESWLLCSEDRFTKRRERIQASMSYAEFKEWYWGLASQFNPIKFNPKKWADISAEAGCKYLISPLNIMMDFVCLIQNSLTMALLTVLTKTTCMSMWPNMYSRLTANEAS